MVYPYYKKLQDLTQNMNHGNFGLWYNKFIPIKSFDSCKASDERGDDNNAVPYYEKKYGDFKKDKIKKLLDKKHRDQVRFCEIYSPGFEFIELKAKLKTPLITGIGESHPHEISMVFDHNLGIPYIPASGIKGIVRFAHTLGLLDNIPDEKLKTDKEGMLYFDDEEGWTNTPQLFGTQNKRGSVIFLDVYPEQVPDLHIDIMNPHFGAYYSDDTNTTPPADYLTPIPIKFLTVAKETVFIFRALVDKEQTELINKVKAAFKKALTEEGVGAKTAIGYGYFHAPVSETANTTNTGKETSPETDPSDTLLEKLLREVGRCRQPGEKSILVQAFEEANALPTTKRQEFVKRVKEVLPNSMKQNAKIKAFLKEKEAELIGSE